MAVSFVRKTNSSNASASSLTFAIDCTGCDGLFVCVYSDLNGTITVSSVTYNAVSMGAAKWNIPETQGAGIRSSGYLLVAPATGSNNVVVTLSGAADIVAASAVGVTGLHQSTPNRTAVTGESTSTNPSISVSNATNGDFVIAGICCTGTSVVAGQTSRDLLSNIAGANANLGVESADATGSQSMTYTLGTGAQIWAFGGMALIPAGGGGGPTLPWLPRVTNLQGDKGAINIASGFIPPNKA